MPYKNTPNCVDCGARVSHPSVKRCRACWVAAPKPPRPPRGWTPNDYRIDGDTAYLALTNRNGEIVAETMIDADDISYVLTRRWSLDPQGYATSATERNGVYDNISLHRFVMRCRPGDGVVVDHRNRNKLDNRKANLLPSDTIHNGGNRERPVSSRFPGVTFSKQTGRWLAQGQNRGQHYYLGRYNREEDAARAYLQWREREGLPAPDDPTGELRHVCHDAPMVRPLNEPTSKYIGVARCKQTGRWRVMFTHQGRQVWLGRHDTEEEAARVAGEWLRAHGRPTLRVADVLNE